MAVSILTAERERAGAERAGAEKPSEAGASESISSKCNNLRQGGAMRAVLVGIREGTPVLLGRQRRARAGGLKAVCGAAAV